MITSKNKAHLLRILGVVLLLASLYSVALSVRRFILLSSYGGIPVREVPFTLESALQYRRVKMIMDRGELPRLDDMVQSPEGIEPSKTYTVFVDHFQAALCRLFPGSLDVSEKLRWIEAGWFCIAIPLLVLWARRATGCWSAGAVAGLLYAVSISAVQRSTGAELSTENTAFPFLAAHFAFRALIRDSGRRYWIWALGSGVSLALAVSSWDLMQFYLYMWSGFGVWNILRRNWKHSDSAGRMWLVELCFLMLVSILDPYHRAHGLAFSPAVIAALIAAFSLWKPTVVRPPVFAALFVIAMLGLRWTPQATSYGHFADLLWAKIRFHNVKPVDPSMLTFEQRLMWTPALHSPTFMLTLQIMAVMFAVNLPAAVAVGRHSRKNLDFQQTLIGFVVSSLAYVFFFRLHVFVAFFGAMLAAAWWGLAMRGETRWIVAVRAWICLGLLVSVSHTLRGPWGGGGRSHAGLWGMREGIYFEEQVELTKWLERNAKPETVLAGFGISGPIAAYGKCAIVLHPKFETKTARNKVKEYAEQLFTGSLASFRDWADHQGASYVVHSMGAFATNEPTLQLRYMVGAMNPPESCPARFFEAGREDGRYFRQVFANRKYRVYQMLTKAEEVAAGVALRRARSAFERGDLDEAERQSVVALRADPNCMGAAEVLKHVMSLRAQGFSTGHEKGP